MEIQNSFATILENESVTVSALLCAETLKIKVKVTDSANEHFGSMFRAEITEQQRKEQIDHIFQSLEQVYQYMVKDKLIKVDLEKETIILFDITKLKQLIILLASKLIKEEKTIEENDEQHLQCLEQILNRCLEKSEIQNDQIKRYFEIIANELITLRKQKVNKNEQNEIKNEFLSQKQQILKIQQQNDIMKTQVEKQNKESSEKFTEFTHKICQLQTQISLQNKKIETLETKINEKSEKIKENAEKIQKLSLLENNLSSKTENVEQKFMNLEKASKHLNNVIKQETQKEQKLQKQKQKQMSLMQKCKNKKESDYFNFDGKTLTKINNNFNFNFFTFFQQIGFDVQFTFNVKIIQKKSYISIGVIDYEDYAKNNYLDVNNCVFYNSNGYKIPKLIKQGNGLKINDFVTVTVNKNTKTIKWFVNNKLQATENAQFLGDRNRKVFPFVELCNEGDKIEFTF